MSTKYSHDEGRDHDLDPGEGVADGHRVELDNAQREVAVLLAVSQALSAWDSFERGSERLLRDLAEALGLAAATLWLRHDDVLVARSIWSIASIDRAALEHAVRPLQFPRGIGVPGRAWERREPISTRLAAARDDASCQSAPHGICAAVALPALAGDEVLGVVEMYSTRATELNDGLMEVLSAVGREMGAFLAHRRGELAPSPLTARELEVLELASQGLTGRSIAERLSISPATVKSHFEHIYAKLAVPDRTSAVAHALRSGLIQ
jgi:DNA-binding CsgD family transcriptional regulator